MKTIRINNRKDILLLLLYSPGQSDIVNEPISGRTRLVKMLYLFKQEALEHFRKGTEINEKNFYEFFAWNFGPFSVQVYDDLQFFILRGFVEPSSTDEEALPESAEEWDLWLSESGGDESDQVVELYQEESYKLTPQGEQFIKGYYDALTKTQRELLRTFKARLSKAPLRAILKYVYNEYQEMTVRSKIKDDILGKNI